MARDNSTLQPPPVIPPDKPATPAKPYIPYDPGTRQPRKPKPITVVNAYVNATSIEYTPDGGQRYVVSLSDFKNRNLLPQIRIRPGMRLKLVLEADQPGGGDAKK